MSPQKVATIENKQTVEASDSTSAEIFALKKELAEKFVKKNFDSGSSIKKWAIREYLVDKDTKIDSFIDNCIIGVLGKIFGLLPPDIKKYREMFTEADTKNKLEDLKKSILNETGGSEQPSTATNNLDTPTKISDSVDADGIVKKACQMAIDIANDNSYGYERGGTGNRNGRKGFDCQSFVRHCYRESGINIPPSGGCGTMKGDFEKAGFECITFNKNDELKPGDILVNPISKQNKPGHTEMCVGENRIAGAHSNKDKKAGDSGGEEISVRSIKSSLSYWDPQFILRYKGNTA